MTTKHEITPTEPEPDETMFFSDPLGDVGQGLAIAMQWSAGNLKPTDRRTAARLLHSIFSYSMLAAGDEDGSSGVVSALLQLHDVAFALCDAHPDLRNEVIADLEREFAADSSELS